METLPPPRPSLDLSSQLYFQLVYTLTGLLPPPIDDSPEALLGRNCAAVAKVAALLPVGANEIDLAAQCIAARAQAEDLLRLVRQHEGDTKMVMRLNAQYGSMVRTSLSVHGRLMRVQAVRQKREAIDGAANEDAWTLHVAERCMQMVVDPDAGQPLAATGEVPRATPAADADPSGKKNISPHGTNSHNAAFETPLSTPFLSRALARADASRLHEAVREAKPESRLAGRELPTNDRDGPRNGGPGYDRL
jgi:hypothetical protein